MDPEFRFYYDENGNFLDGKFETDVIPPGWETYTLLPPPSYLTGQQVVEKFNGTKWVFQFSNDRLKSHRDQRIQVEVTFNNGETEFVIMNDSGTRAALDEVAQGILIAGDNGTIAWKTVNGYSTADATYSDIQGMYLACHQRTQLCRKAEKVVLENHAATPYTDVDDAYSDFDAELI
jgi:hypothetical protein